MTVDLNRMQYSSSGPVRQDICFCKSSDGTNIAFATTGKGPPIVWIPRWLGHLEYELESPICSHWIAELSRDHTLVRYNARGCGLSDRNPMQWSFDAWVRDLEAVADAAGLKEFALLSTSVWAGVAVAYTARNPKRVHELILSSGYARGREKRPPDSREMEERKALLKLIKLSWGGKNPAVSQLLTAYAIPEGDVQEQHAWNEMQRMSMSAENALRCRGILDSLDVTALAPKVTCPTLVLNADRDWVVPLDEGRLLASLIPAARFVVLKSANHNLLAGEPAWQRWVEEVRAFLPAANAASQSERFAVLTVRERELLGLIARGYDNAQLAVQLTLSEKTIRNHITSIFAKLGVENRAQAIILALEAGLGGRRNDLMLAPAL